MTDIRAGCEKLDFDNCYHYIQSTGTRLQVNINNIQTESLLSRSLMSVQVWVAVVACRVPLTPG